LDSEAFAAWFAFAGTLEFVGAWVDWAEHANGAMKTEKIRSGRIRELRMR
jgi:hypothetical protein